MALKIIIGAIVAIALFYIGGWDIVWDQSIFSNKSLVFNEYGFLLLFNGSYYGAEITSRFFESPAVSWGCLMLGTGALTSGNFIFGYFENEEED